MNHFVLFKAGLSVIMILIASYTDDWMFSANSSFEIKVTISSGPRLLSSFDCLYLFSNKLPFLLQERGKCKEEEFMKKLQQMVEEEEKMRVPIAQGLPWTTDEPEVRLSWMAYTYSLLYQGLSLYMNSCVLLLC